MWNTQTDIAKVCPLASIFRHTFRPEIFFTLLTCSMHLVPFLLSCTLWCPLSCPLSNRCLPCAALTKCFRSIYSELDKIMRRVFSTVIFQLKPWTVRTFLLTFLQIRYTILRIRITLRCKTKLSFSPAIPNSLRRQSDSRGNCK